MDRINPALSPTPTQPVSPADPAPPTPRQRLQPRQFDQQSYARRGLLAAQQMVAPPTTGGVVYADRQAGARLPDPQRALREGGPAAQQALWDEIMSRSPDGQRLELAQFLRPGLLRTGPGDISHHDTNSYFTTAYFTARDGAGRATALGALLNEALSGKNDSALDVYRNLSFVDAVAQLQFAPNDEEHQAALVRLARLAERDQASRQYLDAYPQQEAVQQARAQARQEAQRQQQAARQLVSGFQSSHEPAARLAALDRLGEQGARQLAETGDPQLARTAAWLQGQESLLQLRGSLQANQPQQAARLLERLGPEHPLWNEQTLRDLRGTNATDAVLRLRQQLSGQELELARFMTPDDVLNLGPHHPEAVERARQAAREFRERNFQAAERHLDGFLDAASPPQRRQALEGLQQAGEERTGALGSNEFSHTVHWAEATEAAAALHAAADPATAAQHLARLQRLAREQFNPVAARLLRECDSQALLERLAGPEAAAALADARRAVPDGSSELGDYRVRRALRNLEAGSPAPRFADSRAVLQRELESGNEHARQWLPWVEASEAGARIRSATDAVGAAAAVHQLRAQAVAGNPHAQRMLSALLIQGEGEADQNAADDWFARGHGELGRDGELQKPLFLPRLNQLSAVDREAVQLQAAEAMAETLGQRPLTSADATALAVALGRASQAAGPLQPRLQATFQAALRRDPSTALDGLVEGIGLDVPGSLALADTFLGQSQNARWPQHFQQFDELARAGRPAALRVLAAASAGYGGDRDLCTAARHRLVGLAQVPERRSQVLDQLLNVYQNRGDEHELLQTLGGVVAQPGEIPEAARAALHRGLTQNGQQASAYQGMIAMVERWNSADVQAMLSPIRADLPRHLAQLSEKLPEPQRRELIAGLRARLSGTDAAQRMEAMRCLTSLGGYLQSGDLDAVMAAGQDQTQSEALRTQAGRTVLNTLARSADEGLRQRCSSGLLERQWGSLRTNAAEMRPLVEYAAGRPTDLNLTEAIITQIYDAGLPRPTALLFKHWGMAGDDDAVIAAGEAANRNYGPERVRLVATRVASLNALSPQMRQQLTGSELPIDPRQVAAQLANNVLSDPECPNRVLLADDLEQRLSQATSQARRESAELDAQRDRAQRERDQVLRQLSAHTRDGVHFGHRLGYLVGMNHIQEFEARQAEHVEHLQRLDRRLEELSLAQHTGRDGLGPQSRLTFLRMADQARQHQNLHNQGNTRAADRLALELYGEHGTALARYAPSVYADLVRTGERPIERGALQRLHQAGEASRAQLPVYELDTEGRLTRPGFQAALTDLAAVARANQVDRPALSQNALRAIAAEPATAAVTAAAGQLASQLSVLQEMFSAGIEGTRYDAFVRDARQRAQIVRGAVQGVQSHLPQARANLAAMREALQQLPEGSLEKNDLTNKVTALEGILNVVTPGSDTHNKLNYMLGTILSDNFDASTFANWMRKEGLVTLVGIAVAAAITVATLGAGAPLLAVAGSCALSAAGGLAAREITREGLYWTRQAGSNLGTGRSRIGGLIAGDRVLDPNLGERPPTLVNDVLKPYGIEFSLDFAGGMVGVGAGRVLSPLGSRAWFSAQSLLFRQNPAQAQAMAAVVRGVEVQAVGNAAKEAFLKRFLAQMARSLASKAGFSQVTDSTPAHDVMRTLGLSHDVSRAWLGFASSAMLCQDRGVTFGDMREGDPPGLTYRGDPEIVMQIFRRDGHIVERSGAQLRIRTFDGQTFLLEGQ